MAGNNDLYNWVRPWINISNVMYFEKHVGGFRITVLSLGSNAGFILVFKKIGHAIYKC